jgi:hypothetical protein
MEWYEFPVITLELADPPAIEPEPESDTEVTVRDV